jgi:hypothetical protein
MTPLLKTSINVGLALVAWGFVTIAAGFVVLVAFIVTHFPTVLP